MISPSDLELPSKFTSWRPGQLETAAKIVGSQKYGFLLDGPTGCGKSLIAAAVQRLLGTNVTYLCTTKALQDQLLHDFPYARTLKGRNNYVCLRYEKMFPDISAEDCTHSKEKQCEHSDKCPYMLAKRAALSAPLAVLNTAYFLSEVNYVGAFSGRNFLIIDECDMTEGQLMGFIEVVITARQLSNLHVTPPKFRTKFEAWQEWAQKTLLELRPQLRQLERETEKSGAWDTLDIKTLRRKRNLKRLVSKLGFFVREVDKTWVWYPSDQSWSFKPVWVSKYATEALWKHTKRVLGMSATILDPRQVSANTGLAMDNRKYDYVALPSPFPKEHRPVYYEPCANVVNKNMQFALARLVLAIRDIIDKHPDDKILLHCVSYKVRNHLMANIKSDRLVTHSIKDRAKVLEDFKKSSKPLILVSPSMDRGVDLRDEECRVVIIAKIPWADLGDPQISHRIYGSKDGNHWYVHKTISTIVQMSGRAVRSEDDYAITYILDEQFGRLYDEHRMTFPSWFKQAVVM